MFFNKVSATAKSTRASKNSNLLEVQIQANGFKMTSLTMSKLGIENGDGVVINAFDAANQEESGLFGVITGVKARPAVNEDGDFTKFISNEEYKALSSRNQGSYIKVTDGYAQIDLTLDFTDDKEGDFTLNASKVGSKGFTDSSQFIAFGQDTNHYDVDGVSVIDADELVPGDKYSRKVTTYEVGGVIEQYGVEFLGLTLKDTTAVVLTVKNKKSADTTTDMESI